MGLGMMLSNQLGFGELLAALLHVDRYFGQVVYLTPRRVLC
jgi:hypothetical protein